MNISDLSVIVTGAAGGLGKVFCRKLAAGGAKVAAFDINANGLAELTANTGRVAGEIRLYRVNVTVPEEVREAVARAANEIGDINALINNAGIYRDGLLVRRFEQQTLKMPIPQWRAVIDVDLLGPFLMTREVASHMIEANVRKGLIVNISSISRAGNVGQSNYSAAKAAITVDSVVWAEELAEYGIRVASIAPGFVRTPILEAMDPTVLENWINRTPLRRLGSADEIFLGLKFVVECEFFNGRCLEIDGGLRI